MSFPDDDVVAPTPGAKRSDAGRHEGPRWPRRLSVLAAVAVAGGLVAAIVAWRLAPVRYTAQARFHVSEVPPRIIFRTAEPRVDYRTYQRTQMALIRSKLVLNAALREVDDLPVVSVKTDPVAWLEKEIQAEFDGEILRIAMSDANPEALVEIVNAVADAYLSEVVDAKARERRERFEDLEAIYRDYQAKLQEKRATLHRLANNLGTTNENLARITHEMMLERRGLVDQELAKLRIELLKKRAELDVRSREPDGEGGERADSDTESLEVLRRQIRVLEAQVERLSEDSEELAEREQNINLNYVDINSIKDDIAKMERAAARVGAEVEALRVELNAPERIEQIEEADAPRPDHARRRSAMTAGGATVALILVVGLVLPIGRPGLRRPSEAPDRGE